VRAIDTNVIIRFLTGDEPEQSQKARQIIEGGEIFIATTVLLESEWVLRSAYGFPPVRIAGAFRALAGLSEIEIEDPALLSRALDWVDRGMDFADALHLVRANDCSAFVTFDRRLVRLAGEIADLDVALP
jgi:predicted nucleic-acid-binding protein